MDRLALFERHPYTDPFMRPLPLLLKATAALALLLLPAAAARGQSLRVVAADERGITLRLNLPGYQFSTPLPDGRVELRVTGYSVTSLPGRPHLPYAQTLVALPPGAGALLRVVDLGEEEVRDGLRLALGARPVMKDGPDGFGPSPALEPVPPILDGPWPASPVELGEPTTVRRQRLVAVQVRPFRYDEATGRLWVRRSLTVRVDFTGVAPGAAAAAPVTDSHWEPVFRNALANYEQGRRWRAPQPAAIASPAFADRAALPAALRGIAAFDEDQPEVRIKVDSTGAYAFPYDELAAQGYPGGVPVGEVSLHRHEYVGPADPPYVTIELPVEVDDVNANGVFDSGDAIVAFVASWVERSGVTSMMQRDWGDAEVVYATRLAGGAGLRLPTRSGWRDALSPALPASYPWTQRWERSYSYFAYPSPIDTAVVDRFLWTSYFLYYSRPDAFPFEANHLDVTRPVAFRTRLMGRDNNAHVLFGRIQNGLGQTNSVVDSVLWYGKELLTVSVTLPAGALTEGATNSLALWGKGSTAPPDPVNNAIVIAGLDWFEATYWRSYRALSGYLAASSGEVTGVYQVHATGFPSSAIRAYDVTDPVSPVRLALDASHIAPAGSEYTLDFQDSTAGSPRRYVIFDQPKLLPAGRYTTVTRRQLTAATGERDYVVIVPEAFQTAVDPLVTLRQSQGLGTVVAPLESVYDEFNGGRKSRWAIKRFLRYAMESWNARFVVLVGDGSSDPRNLLGSAGADWVPVALIPGPVSSGTYGLEMIPADPWYGWCLDEDPACPYSAVIAPDLYVGRLPVNSFQQAQDVVAKLVAYEAFDPDETWRRRMVLLADDTYSGVSTFGGGGGSGYCYRSYEIVFRLLNQAVAAVIADSSGMSLVQPEVLDLRSYLTDPSLYQTNGPGDTCRVGTGGDPFGGAVKAEGLLRASFNPVLFQKLNEGVLWWNYQGHANPYVLSHEGFYRNQGSMQDRDAFMNDGKLFLFSAFSCHANAFADVSEASPALGPSLGENLLTLPLRGAIASWASSGFEIVPSSLFYHLNVELARSLLSDPPHDDELGRGLADHGARVPLGEAIALTMLNYLPTVRQSALERGVGLTYNLLGDPATRMWVGPAQITVTANGQPVTSGQPVRLASGGDALHLEAELVSNVEIDTVVVFRTGAGGIAEVAPSLYTLTPAFPDTAPSGRGGRRYHLSYTTTLSVGREVFTIRLTDRYGVTASFDVVFEFRTQLYAGGVPVLPNDIVAPDAVLTLLVLSPGTLDADSLRLSVDGAPQSFTAELARGDTTGRQYLLSWSHEPYAQGVHTVRLEAPGGLIVDHTFRVETRFALRDALAFPNPFDDELGTRFVFTLTGETPADVLVRVYTVSGRRVYETRLTGLPPGHHEIPWDGLDAEGQRLANGIYFYKLVAHGAAGTSAYDGRLVKLRRPRGEPDPAAGTTP
jgi:hypothetical protein